MVYSYKDKETINAFINAYYNESVEHLFSETNEKYPIDRWLLADVVHLLLKERRLVNNANVQ